MGLLDAECWVKLKRTSVTSQTYSLSPSKLNLTPLTSAFSILRLLSLEPLFFSLISVCGIFSSHV